MRKYLIGALVGAALALSFNVSAAVEVNRKIRTGRVCRKVER